MNPILKSVCYAVAVLGLGFHGLFSDTEEPPTPPVKTLILPGESFLVEGRPAFMLLPPPDKRQDPQPWILYAPTLPAYPDSHEKWMHEQFLQAGVAVAGIEGGRTQISDQIRLRKWLQVVAKVAWCPLLRFRSSHLRTPRREVVRGELLELNCVPNAHKPVLIHGGQNASVGRKTHARQRVVRGDHEFALFRV